MKRSMGAAVTVMVGAIVIGTSACGGGDVAMHEDVGTAEQALGGPGCGPDSVYPNGGSYYDGYTLSYVTPPSCSYEWLTHTSPDASYDNSSCTNQYIVEVTGIRNRPYSIGYTVGWAGPALTQSTCPYAYVGVAAYAHRYGTSTWDDKGMAEYTGSWVTWGLGGFCMFSAVSNNLVPIGVNQSYYDKVRTAVLAVGLIFKEPVSGGVVYGQGPCGPQSGGDPMSQEDIARISAQTGRYLINASNPSAPMVLAPQ